MKKIHYTNKLKCLLYALLNSKVLKKVNYEILPPRNSPCSGRNKTRARNKHCKRAGSFATQLTERHFLPLPSALPSGDTSGDGLHRRRRNDGNTSGARRCPTSERRLYFPATKTRQGRHSGREPPGAPCGGRGHRPHPLTVRARPGQKAQGRGKAARPGTYYTDS